MTENMKERARELGRMLGQSDEYSALARARQRLTEDRAAVQRMQRLDQLERDIAAYLQNNMEPGETEKEEYERVFTELQSSPVYQGFVAAQSNFDKLLQRMNEEISRGIEAGTRSRIILPS
jgi:cell fate (sporulation/competence/biofilm development) regulator YlbF (YheA/YmcA/DUF963 family)